MPSVRLLLDSQAAERRGLGAHPKVIMVGESGRRVEFPLAPLTNRAGYAPKFSMDERVGRVPLMSRAGFELRTVDLTATMIGRDGDGFLDHQASIENELSIIREMAKSGQRIRFEGYGPSLAGWWILTTMSEQDVRLRQGTNEATQVDIQMTLTEHVEAIAHVGPVSGGAEPPAAASSGPGSSSPEAAKAGKQTYTVKKGDTLPKISTKFYGTPNQGAKIADANGIKSPKKHLTVGKVLTIPPK